MMEKDASAIVLKPWRGGQKPSDWTGAAVLFRSGKLAHAPVGAIWKLGWDHSYGDGDIVAYSVANASAVPAASDAPPPSDRGEPDEQRAREVLAREYENADAPVDARTRFHAANVRVIGKRDYADWKDHAALRAMAVYKELALSLPKNVADLIGRLRDDALLSRERSIACRKIGDKESSQIASQICDDLDEAAHVLAAFATEQLKSRDEEREVDWRAGLHSVLDRDGVLEWIAKGVTSGGFPATDEGLISWSVWLVREVENASGQNHREQGPPCENCGKPVEVGHVVLPYDDVGEMHADCDRPFDIGVEQPDESPPLCVLLGQPMRQIPLAALSQEGRQ